MNLDNAEILENIFNQYNVALLIILHYMVFGENINISI